jgi:lipopolysaccharide biosynthesis protein
MKNNLHNNKMRVLAFYLPQFHTIPENDMWWGKGFTDWSNVRKAKPYYKNQYQPREPLADNYYDLTNIETIKWQADLAKKYNVSGLCFYHYWFNGKLLLEKPSELLLKHTDIELDYCFSWANEPWARTWDGKNNHILMPQSYGDEADWLKHFEYLLPFFKDDRYIKIGNKPMFLLYKSQSIPQCKLMMDYWNRLAVNQGFSGIHFVETLRDRTCDSRELPYEAKVEFEPIRTNYKQSFFVLNYKRIRRRVLDVINVVFKTQIPLNRKYKFQTVASRSLALKSPQGTYGGVFVGWDNTARKGLKGTYIEMPTKDEFKAYLARKIEITQNVYNTNFIFVNAWNEWAEGTYLEPDKKNRFDYLEAIKEVLQEFD